MKAMMVFYAWGPSATQMKQVHGVDKVRISYFGEEDGTGIEVIMVDDKGNTGIRLLDYEKGGRRFLGFLR